MKESFCEVLLQYHPKPTELKDLYSTFITNCVFNSFLCYTAIMLNIVTIHAIRKTSSLPETLKTLLLSLAVSDVIVSLLVQPFYASIMVKWIQQNIPSCSTYMVFVTITNFFSLASFSGVVAVSVDRFLAIHLHLRYQELVTHKRVVAVVISIWVFSIFLSLLTLWVPLDIYSLIFTVLGVVGIALTTLVYIRIFLAIRRHKNQIQALQVQQVAQTEEMANFASIIKSVVGIFYVYLVILICYLPFLICLVAIKINGTSIVLKRYILFSVTLVYVSSSLNPVIYSWKMRHIRHAIMDIQRNIMSWYRNRASH